MAHNHSDTQVDAESFAGLKLATEVEKEATQLEFNARHLVAEDDKEDALKMVDAARAMMRESAARLRAVLTGKFPS